MRILDIIFSFFGLLFLLPLISLVSLICYFETGRAFYFQTRVGRNKKYFILIKFPTMKKEAPSMPSHLIDPVFVTKTGKLIRRIKLDELPQLFNVLKGEMSLVGPRPCLPIQEKLISEREKRGIYKYLPGITGIAQINNIDMSDPVHLAHYDEIMVNNLNIKNYFKCIILTILGKGTGDKVRDYNEIDVKAYI